MDNISSAKFNFGIILPMKYKKFFSKIKFFVITLAVGLVFAGVITYAWNALWHDPASWVQTGKTIKAKELGETLEFLKQTKVAKLDIPECAGDGKALQWNGSAFVCKDIQTTGRPCLYNGEAGRTIPSTWRRYNRDGSGLTVGREYNDGTESNQICVNTGAPYSGDACSRPSSGQICYVYVCSNGKWLTRITNAYSGSTNPYNCSCFTKDSLVTMADGTQKPISKIKKGDKVLSKGGGTNTVLGIETPKLGSRKLYSINGGPFFFTAEHPFLTKEGWKSISLEETKKEEPRLMKVLNMKDELKVGDVLITEDGEITIETIESKQAPDQTLYNLMLDGDHTYIVNGYVVHNKAYGN